MKIAYCVCAVLLSAPSLRAGADPPPSVSATSATQQRAFQLGFALGLPAARAARFIRAVGALGEGADDVASRRKVKSLHTLADTLRLSEAASYRQVSGLLHAAGSPPTLLTAPDAAASLLAAPLVLSEEAKPFSDTDPDTAAVLATLDENDTLQSRLRGSESSLRVWLKLSYGQSALWAYDLGTLTAGLHDALVSHETLRQSPPAVADLRVKTPASASLRIRAALSSLAAAPIAPDALATAHDTLLESFGAEKLLGKSEAERSEGLKPGR